MVGLKEKDIIIYKIQFVKLVLKYSVLLLEGKDVSHINLSSYRLSKKFGKSLYESFSDEELLAILKKGAKILNHTPAQREVPQVFREYIKFRFKKWPYAIKAAGLSKAGGSGGKSFDQMEKDKEIVSNLMERLRVETYNRGYIPHPHQVEDIAIEIKKYFKSWKEVVENLNLDNDKITWKKEAIESHIENLLEELKILCFDILGRAPMKHEVDSQALKLLMGEFGSWRNILFQIGLEPLIRKKRFENTYLDHRKRERLKKHSKEIADYRFKVLNLSEMDIMDLSMIQRIKMSLDREINRNDVPYEIINRLMQKCASWQNIIYQLEVNKSLIER